MTEDAAQLSQEASDHPLLEEWPLRPWVLAGIGALAGLLVWALVFEDNDPASWRLGLGAFVFFAAVAAGFTLRPRGWVEPVIFALGLGVVMGGIAFMAAEGSERLADTPFAFAAGVFFSILAVPLFQADFHRKRFATPYAETHFHVWTDAVSAGGAFAFTLLSWLLLWLLHGLFSLVGIEIIEDLIRDEWFVGVFMGLTFGAALGVLRDNLGILGGLQRVVMLVFSLLAVPFALAILIFLCVLLLSGGNALWQATDDATPVLLACAVGCFVLANAVVRDDDTARSGNWLMQAAASFLSFAILPLAVFAAISMGIRIGQYGLAPERIWALVAIAVAVAYGVAYWAGLVRGRLAGWSDYLRRANLHLAALTCVLALILALPLFDFGAMSARNQLARLERGAVSVDDFDYAALRWDFGDAGRKALVKLAAGEGEVAELAAEAQALTQRPYGQRFTADHWGNGAPPVTFRFADPEARRWISSHLRTNPWQCQESCVAIDIGGTGDRRRFILLTQGNVQEITFRSDGVVDPPAPVPAPPASVGAESKVEVRPFSGRQVYVDGQPVGQPFE